MGMGWGGSQAVNKMSKWDGAGLQTTSKMGSRTCIKMGTGTGREWDGNGMGWEWDGNRTKVCSAR